ncbi:MAG: DNA repair protein RadA, partial [Opitutae bacterium]|nr:DNA repair protein RadA [Opitutae bacterium]
MAKATTIFSCQKCGHQAPKWLGRCPECSSWNSFAEESNQPIASKSRHKTKSSP